jgi:hypothetical protein
VSAAADLTRYPLVGEFRLVDVIASGPALPVPETTSTENTMEAVIFMNWVAQNSQPSEVVVGSKLSWVKSLAGYLLTIEKYRLKYLTQSGPIDNG